ncbi:hypothetical protein [Vibrio ishigakensis]|uniref:hypothetical protein n=1 Tax=Vibrio ishigakensis TaxID=1481914 RepID=UPI0021C34451|nr:hypothetical protein [Vibrio ishigakensis]
MIERIIEPIISKFSISNYRGIKAYSFEGFSLLNTMPLSRMIIISVIGGIMDHSSNRVQVELSTEKLEQLIQEGHICASQIRCLNSESKQTVWQMCLKICGKKMCQAQCLAVKRKQLKDRLL